MKKMILPLLSAGLVFVACEKKENPASYTDDIPVEVVADSISAVPVEIRGTFVGELPCADCEGITETLILNDDGTFARETAYKGEKEPTKEQGTYKVEGAKISLEGGKDGESNLYEVEGDKLHKLTLEGKKVEGELANSYILTKK